MQERGLFLFLEYTFISIGIKCLKKPFAPSLNKEIREPPDSMFKKITQILTARFSG